MKHFGKAVVKLRYVILIASILLLIPAGIGYIRTRVNYDILSYLPAEIESMKGQEIMAEEFGTGAFSMVIVEGMEFKDISAMKEKMEQVDHVKKVIWYDSFADISIPVELLPDRLREVFLTADGDETLMAVTFDTTMSADETMDAIEQLREVVSESTFLSGMSATVLDTKNLAKQEAPIYIALAVLLCTIVLALTMDSFLIPFVFLISIGIAIAYNMGSNIFLGEISYITSALAAVLQLGVTLDYSIFLWHSYQEKQEEGLEKQEAMAEAINATLVSVIGSSITTVAGFIALCFMHFTLGMDLGIVMSKGVIFGVIGCTTILPSLILLLDKPIEKTRHKPLLGKFKKIPHIVQKIYPLILIVYAVMWIPAIHGYNNTEVYYNLTASLPGDLPGVAANEKLQDDFEMATTHMILVDGQLEPKTVREMCDRLKSVDGIKSVIGLDAMLDPSFPREMLDADTIEIFQNENWQFMLLQSEYEIASDAVNNQCNEITAIIKEYDPDAMLVGEAPGTKDLIEVTDEDFNTVNSASMGIIMVIIFFVFRSLSLPVILVATIEFAIYINMGIPYYTGTTLPFIASIIIGTVQLGSTVDYAILMTSRYKQERASGKSRKDSVLIAHSTAIPSILVSALSFFAATFGVGMYSKMDIVSSLCTLMARGALISMVTVILVLPSALYAFDWIIIHTSMGFKARGKKSRKSHTDDSAKHGSSSREPALASMGDV